MPRFEDIDRNGDGVIFTVSHLSPSEPRDDRPVDHWDHPIRSKIGAGHREDRT